jgi:hypothetical protein
VIEDAIERIKAVPKPVWIVGGVVIVAAVVLSRGTSASTSQQATDVVGVGSGSGGGDYSPDLNQQFVDLAAAVNANTAADKAFRDSLAAQVNTATPSTTTVGLRPGSRLPLSTTVPGRLSR